MLNFINGATWTPSLVAGSSPTEMVPPALPSALAGVVGTTTLFIHPLGLLLKAVANLSDALNCPGLFLVDPLNVSNFVAYGKQQYGALGQCSAQAPQFSAAINSSRPSNWLLFGLLFDSSKITIEGGMVVQAGIDADTFGYQTTFATPVSLSLTVGQLIAASYKKILAATGVTGCVVNKAYNNVVSAVGSEWSAPANEVALIAFANGSFGNFTYGGDVPAAYPSSLSTIAANYTMATNSGRPVLATGAGGTYLCVANPQLYGYSVAADSAAYTPMATTSMAITNGQVAPGSFMGVEAQQLWFGAFPFLYQPNGTRFLNPTYAASFIPSTTYLVKEPFGPEQHPNPSFTANQATNNSIAQDAASAFRSAFHYVPLRWGYPGWGAVYTTFNALFRREASSVALATSCL